MLYRVLHVCLMLITAQAALAQTSPAPEWIRLFPTPLSAFVQPVVNYSVCADDPGFIWNGGRKQKSAACPSNYTSYIEKVDATTGLPVFAIPPSIERTLGTDCLSDDQLKCIRYFSGKLYAAGDLYFKLSGGGFTATGTYVLEIDPGTGAILNSTVIGSATSLIKHVFADLQISPSGDVFVIMKQEDWSSTGHVYSSWEIRSFNSSLTGPGICPAPVFTAGTLNSEPETPNAPVEACFIGTNLFVTGTVYDLPLSVPVVKTRVLKIATGSGCGTTILDINVVGTNNADAGKGIVADRVTGELYVISDQPNNTLTGMRSGMLLSRINPAAMTLVWMRSQLNTSLGRVAGAKDVAAWNGRVVMTGYRSRPGAPSGALQYVDWLTASYSSAGVLGWTNWYGGPGGTRDEPVRVEINSCEDVIVAGSEDLLPTSGTYPSNCDMITVRYSTSGLPLTTTRFDQGYGDFTHDLDLDASGNPYITGYSDPAGSLALIPAGIYTLKYATEPADSLLLDFAPSPTGVPDFLGVTLSYAECHPVTTGGSSTTYSSALISTPVTHIAEDVFISGTIGAPTYVTSALTFNNCVVHLSGILEVGPKGRLVFNNCQFIGTLPTSQIIIDADPGGVQGGKMFGNGTDFSSGCPGCTGMWAGIWVKGDITLNSHTALATFGEVRLFNCQVRNAYTGIRASEGGYLNTEQCAFTNNQRDIWITPWAGDPTLGGPYDNLSVIRNNRFESTNLLKDPSLTDAYGRRLTTVEHIRVEGWRTLNILSNTFENTMTGFPADLLGVGVYSASTGINIAPAITGGAGNVFKNLFYGVWCNGAPGGPVVPFTRIRENTFRDCIRGVFAGGCNRVSICSNVFNTIPQPPFVTYPGFPGTTSAIQTVGIDVFGGLGDISILNNLLYAAPGGSIAQRALGLVMEDGGSPVGIIGANLVQGNTFTGYMLACLNTGNNTNLQYECNDFTNTATLQPDIAVTTRVGGAPGILWHQGSPFGALGPTANQFNQTVPSSTTTGLHLWACATCNPPLGTDYFYHLSPPLNPYFPKNEGMTMTRWNVFAGPANSNPCPLIGCQVQPLNILFAELTRSIELHDSLLQLFDGGNTAYLLSVINPTSGYSPGVIRNILLANGPLSDTVLMALLTRSPQLPAAHLRTILVANAPLSDELIAAMDALSSPLTPAQRAMVIAACHLPSYRRDLLAGLHYTEWELAYLQGQISAAYLEAEQADSAVWVYEQFAGIAPRTDAQIPFLLASYDSSAAASYNGTILGMPGCYHTYAKNWISARKRPFSLTLAEKSDLNSICSSGTHAGIQAALWLNAIGELNFSREYSLPDLGTASKMEETEETIPGISLENELLLVFPNPASDQVFVELSLSDQVSIATVRVLEIMTGAVTGEYAVTGRGALQFMVTTQGLPPGVYLVQLVTDGAVAGYEKLIITR